MTDFRFDLLSDSSGARRGRISTAHGPVETPAFMAVGTAGTVKGLTPAMVARTGTQVVLGNTYHLMLRPGAERVERLGGLHRMMGWPGPILTDSGGYQVMSLAGLRRIAEEGVTFKSHIDGSEHVLSPERSTEIQRALDATITMAFDECTPFPATPEVARSSMELSMRWAARSRAAFLRRAGYGQFGIVQGGVHLDLRARSVEALTGIGFEGYAIGGLAVGEPQAEMFRVLDGVTPLLPADRPRYLMGVGKPGDLVGAVARGVDMFDCVIPTRSGRTGQAFTSTGVVNIRNARHAEDPGPLDPACPCPVCVGEDGSGGFSRAYLHHLDKAKEMLGPILLSWHNLAYYQSLMREMREAIEADAFPVWQDRFEANMKGGPP